MKFNFTTKLEDADVIVFWEYESDENGVYNSEVVQVVFNGISIMPILSSATLCELDSKAMSVYEEQFHD
jgi:hypothetical protein